eukprot:TRINITY_DN1559_c0_g2_i2.p1 TRINITY_DN1559_c0_g2~~TRINITY_DN1559_c0_g2_i2.p1  ORF type:complete len:570 (-),score=63.47 TRINITY_DN1559_c0_g2_i2:895-2604(-)
MSETLPASTQRSIFQAILFKEWDILESFIDTSKSDYVLHLKAKDELGRTALYFACQHGELGAVEKIIATAAANIDATENNGWTPLMVAAFHGHVDICNKLLELSANVDTKEQLFGWTPLLAAVWNGHREVIELLIRNNSSTKIKDRNGRNALFLAAQRNHTDVIEQLLKHKLDVNETDNYGRTPLYIAVQMSHLRAVERLCDGGADIDKPDQDGRRPLFLAYKSVSESISEYLVGKGANTDALECGEAATVVGKDGPSVSTPQTISPAGPPPPAAATESAAKPCRGKLLGSASPTLTKDSPTKVVSFAALDGRVWGGCNDGSIVVWSMTTRELLTFYPKVQKKTVHHLVVVQKAVWALSGNQEIFVWKWNENDPSDTRGPYDPKQKLILVSTLSQGQEINCLVRFGQDVLGGSMSSTLFVWNSRIYTAKEVKIDTSAAKLHDYENFVSSILYHRDMLFVAVLKYILCYDARSLAFKFCLEGHTGLVTSMVGIGSQIWSASKDNRIRVWDIEKRTSVHTFDNAGGGYVTCLIYTKDDQVLSGGGDGQIKSWSVSVRVQLALLSCSCRSLF